MLGRGRRFAPLAPFQRHKHVDAKDVNRSEGLNYAQLSTTHYQTAIILRYCGRTATRVST